MILLERFPTSQNKKNVLEKLFQILKNRGHLQAFRIRMQLGFLTGLWRLLVPFSHFPDKSKVLHLLQCVKKLIPVWKYLHTHTYTLPYCIKREACFNQGQMSVFKNLQKKIKMKYPKKQKSVHSCDRTETPFCNVSCGKSCIQQDLGLSPFFPKFLF